MRSPLRVGVVGLGVISRFYLAALRTVPGMTLAAVCDRDPTALAARAPDVPGYIDHTRMLDRERLDAVVVTAPNDVHAPVCADALRRGTAVCVEKPLAMNPAQGRALADLARARGVPLFTAFHRRYNDAVTRLREQITGRPVAEVTVRYLERIEEHAGTDTWYLDPARCGGGCVADNGPNAFDLVEWLLGPVEVTAARIARDGAGVDRWADIALRARKSGPHRPRVPGGPVARVLLDWSHPGERKDVEVRIADGTVLRADMLDGHSGFKESLWHEYVGVLTEFGRRVRGGLVEDPAGTSALRLVGEAYRWESTAYEERTREATG